MLFTYSKYIHIWKYYTLTHIYNITFYILLNLFLTNKFTFRNLDIRILQWNLSLEYNKDEKYYFGNKNNHIISLCYSMLNEFIWKKGLIKVTWLFES